MGKPPFHEVERLFHEALAHPSEERRAFLDAACAGDTELRAAVEELLCHAGPDGPTDGFLASPMGEAAAKVRAELPTLRGASTAPLRSAGIPLPQIAGYELLGELGRGGMGIVYKVRQTSLNRIIALKMLPPGAPADAQSLARFRTEAEALARLHHPNIVTIYDIGEWEGRPYFTMEYVAGPSLARLLGGRPQNIADSARLIETLARTMDAVHQQGIIHRDLKPANVLLQPVESGEPRAKCQKEPGTHDPLAVEPSLSALRPKITDFGLAKDRAAAGKLTQSGLVMGSPCYMAPEQAQGGGGVGPGADVYALGVILYEMLTGRPPFEGDSPVETLAQVLNEEPLSPSRLRPRLARDLTTICLKCLEKSPRNRYATALELAEDLHRFLAGKPIRARPVGPLGRTVRWCRRRPLVAALLLLCSTLTLVLLITVLSYNARLQDALGKAERISEEERQQIVQLNVSIGLHQAEVGESCLALLRFTEALRLDQGRAEQERNHRIRIATTLRQCPRLLSLWADDSRVLCTRLGPEGGWVGSVDGDNRLRVRNARSGQSRGAPVPVDAPLRSASLSLDGTTLVTLGTGGQARIWHLATGRSEPLPFGAEPAVRRIVLHPEGRVLLTEDANATVRLWDLTVRPLVRPPPLSGQVLAALSDNGRFLFTLGPDGLGRVWDLGTRQVVAAPQMRAHDVHLGALSPDGTRVAVCGKEGEARVCDVAGGNWLGRSLSVGAMVRQCLFSPDGDRLVTFADGGPIRIWHVQTGEQIAAWSGQGTAVTQASFSPDGRQLIALHGEGEVRVWDVATGRARTLPLRPGGPMVSAAFWANGKEVAAISASGTVSVWGLAGSDAVQGAPLPDKLPPAAGDLARRPVRLGNGLTVQVARPATGARLRLPWPGERTLDSAAFSPDGRRLVVLAEQNAAHIWDATTGVALTGPLRHKAALFYAAFSSVGLRLITLGEDRTARVWDVRTGEALTPPLPIPKGGQRALFSGDGTRAVVVHQDGTRTLWDLTPDARAVSELVGLAQVLAGTRVDEAQQPQLLQPHELRATWARLQTEP
jgi:serine/threonine protein kinase/WD40 repeat protein